MTPDYSIIVPAFNEAHWLPKTLANLKLAIRSQSQTGELIVVDNNSNDNTAEIARSSEAKVIYEPINQISRARNTGAHAARGRYLFFVDADTSISSDLLTEALELLNSGEASGGGAVVEFDGPVDPLATIALQLWTSISTKLSLAAGCFIFCRQQDFIAVGGFSQEVYASEEVWLSLALKRKAKKLGTKFYIITKYPAISSARKLYWYNLSEKFLLLCMGLVFPFFVRFKGLCRFWYYRPKNPKNDHSAPTDHNLL